MNFDKIFFQLLILKTLYQCGLSLYTEIAPLSEITVLNERRMKYTSASLAQYEDKDRFRISDPDNATLYSEYFKSDFTSNMIEFSILNDDKMEFLLRRSDNQIVRCKCFFAEKQFIQEFFRKIYSYQEKGDSVMISRIARYSDKTRQIEQYVKNATMHSKDITVFSNEIVERTYIITHYNDTSSTMELEVDIIFPAKIFAISEIYEDNKIALCTTTIPDERFLIRFSDSMAGYRFLTANMPQNMQRDTRTLPCQFPRNLTAEQIFENLEL